MKKIAIMCAVLLSIACFMTAFAASSSKTPPVKGGIPEGTKIYAAEHGNRSTCRTEEKG